MVDICVPGITYLFNEFKQDMYIPYQLSHIQLFPWWEIIPTYDTYDDTGRGPDGPCTQISAGYQVSVVELSYTSSLLPWGAHALYET